MNSTIKKFKKDVDDYVDKLVLEYMETVKMTLADAMFFKDDFKVIQYLDGRRDYMHLDRTIVRVSALGVDGFAFSQKIEKVFGSPAGKRISELKFVHVDKRDSTT